MSTVLVLNGPNLNRLGTREPGVYGTRTLDDIRVLLQNAAPAGTIIDLRQSNSEGQLIDWLHEATDSRTPVVFNPAGYTHTSVALRDAVALLTETGTPLVEVHLSNPHAREPFRHVSHVSPVASGVIAGFGHVSYLLALQAVLQLSEA